MFQRRPHRPTLRSRSLAVGGAMAALAVVAGGSVAAVKSPAAVEAGDIQLTQNAAGQGAAQELPLGATVDLDLEPVVARAAGGTIPDGTTVQVTGLPDGLAQDGWVISGTPTRAGEYDVLVTVSNSELSRSEKVTVAVVDGAGQSGEGPTTNPATDATTQSDPTLSAVPGDPALANAAPGEDDGDGDGDGAGDSTGNDDEAGGDDEAGAPDLCTVLGDGQVDGASLAQLLPLVAGADDAESTGLVMVLLNTVVNLLPSVLGESGSMEGLGSVGEILCTISPSLLGGQSAATTGGDTTDGGATAGAAALDGGPAALLGLLTTGAGSLGQ